jgi:hypothetical protein
MSLITNHEYSNMNIKTLTRSNKIYISLLYHPLETCHWCASYFDKTRLLATEYNYNDEFADCTTVDTLSYFHILSNESVTFNYTDQCEVELKFKSRRHIKIEVLKKGAESNARSK